MLEIVTNWVTISSTWSRFIGNELGNKFGNDFDTTIGLVALEIVTFVQIVTFLVYSEIQPAKKSGW